MRRAEIRRYSLTVLFRMINFRPNIFFMIVPAILVAEGLPNSLPTSGEQGVEIRTPSPLPSEGSKGHLEGQVLYRGPSAPRPAQVENATEPRACAKLQSLENIIVSSKNHGIKNVIITLKGVPLPAGYIPPTSRLILDNRNCRFRPHVAVLTTGSSIEAVNSDPIFHSVHLYGFRNLNLALAPRSTKVVRTVRHPGYIIVQCDIHGWMKAFIRVDRHPFHSVSAADGSFRIEGIPPGSYTLEVWHEYFGPKEIEVSIERGSVSRVIVTYTSS